MRNFLALLFGSILLASGCESATEVVNEHRARVDAKLAKLRTSVKAPPVATPPVLADKLAFSGEAANAIVVLRESLLEPPTKPQHDLIRKHDLLDSVTDALAVPGKRNTKLLRPELAQFLKLRYVVVLSTWSFSEGRARTDKTFEGGAWSGAISILDLDKGGPVGMLTASSSSSDTIKSSRANLNSNLRSDVYGHAAAAINLVLEPFVAPGQRAL